ncbi:hypothetical protein DUNSADRAFT_8679 [Dunaliella salina]|uniref:Uncharacterized protein n=1 Tax=Dunaliella salina TaxID=3046 RepID=A0ABQ7GJ21_DUNSA|nr:hypothetical protein DUNSADRAFT_8679 [Dunaliella salina]|eukprot:KAF5834596.1 hypothetical protein DUNSADRAFT_8679 [Dunaliella salina]
MLPLPSGLSPDGVVPSLDAALQSICAEMARALFPRFAPLFIHHCLEELTAPGLFPQAHIAAITLLRSMMLQATASLSSTTSTSTTPSPEANANGCATGSAGEIDLGPGVINSLTNTSLLAPLVERTQTTIPEPMLTEGVAGVLQPGGSCCEARGRHHGWHVCPPRPPHCAHHPLPQPKQPTDPSAPPAVKGVCSQQTPQYQQQQRHQQQIVAAAAAAAAAANAVKVLCTWRAEHGHHSSSSLVPMQQWQ